MRYLTLINYLLGSAGRFFCSLAFGKGAFTATDAWEKHEEYGKYRRYKYRRYEERNPLITFIPFCIFFGAWGSDKCFVLCSDSVVGNFI